MTDDKGEIDLNRIAPLARNDAAGQRERAEQEGLAKVDGRNRRRKNRTAAMTFRFSPEIREAIIRMADAENVDFVEIVEEAVKLLDRAKRGKNDGAAR
jgi:hypothetical protein